jgi:biopolymer transport protein ExbD
VTAVIHAQTEPPQGTTVFLPRLYRPYATDCMDRSVFLKVGLKGVSILTEPGHRFSDRQLDVISERIAQIMASRWERVVYVLGDRAVTYGDVTMLIASLNRSTTDLNVILVSQADLDGLQSDLCLGVGISQSIDSRSDHYD